MNAKPEKAKVIDQLINRINSVRDQAIINEWTLIDLRNQALRLREQLGPKEPFAGFIAAWCLERLNKHEEAVELVEQGLSTLPLNLDKNMLTNIYAMSADIFYLQKNMFKALEMILSVPDFLYTPHHYYLASNIFFHNDMWAQIIEMHNIRSQRDSEVYQPSLGYLFCLVRNRDFQELSQIYAKHPQLIDVFLSGGEDLRYMGVRVDTKKTIKWISLLNQALNIVKNIPQEKWNFEVDGITYAIQLDGSYVAYDLSSGEEAWGETVEKAKINLTQNTEHDSDWEWLEEGSFELLPDDDATSTERSSNLFAHYKPGIGLFIS